METPTARPWYKKKRYLIPLGTISLLWVAALGSETPQSPAVVPTGLVQEATAQTAQKPTYVPVAERETTVKTQTTQKSNYIPVAERSTPAAATTQDSSNLSNDNYYTNTAGNSVHSPAYAPSIPAGASAQCRDGTYSFSQSRRGTCSHHGGVAEWI